MLDILTKIGKGIIKLIDFQHMGVFEGGESDGDAHFVMYDNLGKMLDILTKMGKGMIKKDNFEQRGFSGVRNSMVMSVLSNITILVQY